MSQFSPSLATAKVSAFLNVRQGAKAIDFYQAAFDAKILHRFDAPDGSVVAQLGIGESDFWLADEALEYQNHSPESLNGTTLRMVLVVDDPDAVFATAIAAGAKSICPVQDEEYGWRIGRLMDPFGHHWEIGKTI
ncbi:VOC family protein [Acidicapsa dinghuensis]|uniref:VOC family protein n=1 Tax=Acidicapsa dinghuensis TaxID=2218256 RepID=A0ABW1E974_9BACT|nr:VOC family protein [Acidicapsa dinghuensis]